MQLDELSGISRISEKIRRKSDIERYVRLWLGRKVGRRCRGKVMIWSSDMAHEPKLFVHGEIWVGTKWLMEQPELQPIIVRHILCS